MTESTFTFRVDEKLKTAFTAATKANDRTGAQVLREVMRDYVAEEAPPSAERLEWLSKKVEKARAQVAAGQFYSNDQMKERMAKKRVKLLADIERGPAA